jgi:hypothetical protein
VGNLPAFEVIEQHFVAMKIRPVDRRIVEDDLDIEAAGLGVAQKKKNLGNGVLMLFEVGVDDIGADERMRRRAEITAERSAFFECEKVDEKKGHGRGRNEIVKHTGKASDRLS